MSADQETLEQLHAALAAHLLTCIKQGEPAPALLNVARQFLKDNGIESLSVPGSPIHDLLSSLPDFDSMQ